MTGIDGLYVRLEQLAAELESTTNPRGKRDRSKVLYGFASAVAHLTETTPAEVLSVAFACAEVGNDYRPALLLNPDEWPEGIVWPSQLVTPELDELMGAS